MKISFAIYSLGSGGAERVVSLLANYLVNKYEVEIITFTKDESFYKLDDRIVHTKLGIDFISKNKVSTIFNIFKRIKILSGYLKKSNPNVVISFMTHTNILSIIASKIANKKIIISERIAYDFYGKKINFIKNLAYRFSNMLVVQTKNDAKFYNIKKDTIPNPLEIKCQPSKKENIILAVGRLNKQKGFDALIKIFSKIDTNWKLIIAGEGKERENLKKLIKKDNIFLIGNQKDIFSWYSKASIFVLSSKKEGFPNVLLEAMGCECACVSFDCPYGPSEIIENGKNGVLIENQNREKFQQTLENLINDKKLRTNLSCEAVKVRDKYSIEKIARKWENVIKEVIDE